MYLPAKKLTILVTITVMQVSMGDGNRCTFDDPMSDSISEKPLMMI